MRRTVYRKTRSGLLITLLNIRGTPWGCIFRLSFKFSWQLLLLLNFVLLNGDLFLFLFVLVIFLSGGVGWVLLFVVQFVGVRDGSLCDLASFHHLY